MIPNSIGNLRNALGQSDTKTAAYFNGQSWRIQYVIRVAQPPKLKWIAEVKRGDIIEPVTLYDDMLLKQRKPIRRGNEAALEIANLPTIGGFIGRRLNVVVSACWRK